MPTLIEEVRSNSRGLASYLPWRRPRIRLTRMADAIFEHPRLAAMYDALDPDCSDLAVYSAIADELRHEAREAATPPLSTSTAPTPRSAKLRQLRIVASDLLDERSASSRRTKTSRAADRAPLLRVSAHVPRTAELQDVRSARPRSSD